MRTVIFQAGFVILMAAAALFFQHCAARVSKSKSVDTYREDVTALRPQLPPEEAADAGDLQTASVIEKAPYTAPRHDVTDVLDEALEQNAEITRSRPYTVFTVQVYNGRSRMQANEVRRQVYSVMPDAKPVLEYRQPNYKVKVGAFASRAEAHKTFKKLQQTFPGTVLVPERVVPEEDNGNR